MNIPKAIEILEKEHEHTFMGSEKDWKDAVKLGFEALRRIDRYRNRTDVNPAYLLPGETD